MILSSKQGQNKTCVPKNQSSTRVSLEDELAQDKFLSPVPGTRRILIFWAGGTSYDGMMPIYITVQAEKKQGVRHSDTRRVLYRA